MVDWAQSVNRTLSRRWQVPAIAALVLVTTSFYSYLLFHTLLEFATVLIAMGACIVTWRTFTVSRNHYLMVLGCGYFWIGAVDLMHALAYQGMQVLPSIASANESTQLWIAARFGEAVLLLAAPLFATRPIRRGLAFTLFGAIAVLLFTLVMSGNFPDCFIEGKGLTPFKVYSEYAIIAILAGAMAHLWHRRGSIDPGIVSGILLANVFTIGAELSFTQYASVYGPANLVGHVFKLFAFWMIYSTLVELAFRQLSQATEPDAGPIPTASGTFRIAVGGAVLVPLVIYVIFGWHIYNRTMREAERDVQRSAEIFYRHALNVFQSHELIADRVNERVRGMSWDEIEQSQSVHDDLRKIIHDFPQAQAIGLADSSGTLRNASQPLSASSVSVADRDYFRALRVRDVGTVVGSLVQSGVMQGWSFSTAGRRQGASDAFDGVVIVTNSERYFSDFWNQSVSEVDSSIYLMRRDGAFLARAPRIDPLILVAPADAKILEYAGKAESGAFRAVSKVDGIERLYAFHTLPRYDVVLVYGAGVQGALAPWRNDLATFGTLFGSATIVLLMLLLLARRTARQAELRERNVVLEERVRERTSELAAANKGLEAFSYSASHDLRGPLRAIDGFARVLEKDYAAHLDEKGRDTLRRVREAARKMGQLIDDLLQLSRVERSPAELEAVDLSVLARAIAERLNADEPGRRVTFEIPPRLEVRGDWRLLEVVLENLLGNAWKFTARHASARIELGVTEQDGKRAYFVRDDGAGFDPAHAAQLFEPFQRLHAAREFPGNGIGLATVKRIVELHGGRIWAEAAVEKGATFYFTISH